MIQIFISGGPVMYVLLFLSLVSLTIVVERFMYFRKNRVNEDLLLSRLKSTMEKGHYEEALAICDAQPSPITNLMKVGISLRDQPVSVVRDMVMDTANQEIPKMEQYITTLGTISTIAPLLGLFGTVQGIIMAFNVLNQLAGVGDPAALAGGIGTALITTAAGIIVAVPATIFYNYLTNKVNHSIIRLENRVNELVLYLDKARRPQGGTQ
ncbi:MAG: flagellar motor protein MotA [Spirochaetes bacterium GWB1_48_6]|nr:MAG: flagellar motor protein MotA [Spirochaetes bacterium GWB1_48_6]